MTAKVIDLRARGAAVLNPVRAARAQLGLTRAEFAAVLSAQLGAIVKPGYIAAWEDDDPPPSSDIAEACQALAAAAAARLPDPPAGHPDNSVVVFPAWTPDERLIWVSIPRRMFLSSGLGAAALTAIAAAADPRSAVTALTKLRALPDGAADLTPIERLRRLRRVLVDSDNMLGSGAVIPAVHGQIQVIQRLRATRSGADRRALLALQADYAEFAGWLHQDARDFPAARYWLDRALELSHGAADHELATYVMARKSQLAGDMGDAADAVDLADAAATMAQQGGRMRAAAATYGAHGHALAGERSASMRTIDRARELVDRFGSDPASPWATWLDASYIDVQRARCLSSLGDHTAAAAIFQQAIAALPPSYRRDRGVYLAREALAHARARDPEQAADVGLRAVATARETQSGRIAAELAEVGAALAPWKTLPAVGSFHEALASVSNA